MSGSTREEPERQAYPHQSKNASSVAAEPSENLNIEDLFPILHNIEVLVRKREGRLSRYNMPLDSEIENKKTSVSGLSGSRIRRRVH